MEIACRLRPNSFFVPKPMAAKVCPSFIRAGNCDPRDGLIRANLMFEPRCLPRFRGAQLQKLARSGRIVSVLYAPRGEIRGAVLEDGSQFLIPVRPAESNQFGLQAGASVDLKGYGNSNAFGTCLEATELSVNGGTAMIL